MTADGEPSPVLRALARPRAVARRWLGLAARRRLAVFVGGVLGTALRTAVTDVVPGEVTTFPWPVWAVNVSGSLVLGYLATRFLVAGNRSPLTMPLLCIGLLGSYTTFSTFAVEVVQLADAGRSAVAATYAASSVAVGLAAAWLGIRLGQARP